MGVYLFEEKKTMTELRYEGRIEILCFRIESSKKKVFIEDKINLAKPFFYAFEKGRMI